MREVLAWVRRAIGLGLALTVLLCCSACTERQDASVEAPARAEQGSLPAGEPGNAAEPAAEYPADGFYVKDGQICLIRGGKPVQTAEDGSFQGYAYRCYGEDGLCSVDAELLATADGQLYHLIDGMPDTQEGLLELDGALYCRQSGGILLRDGDWQTLHFGASGRYTSGNVTIDRYIDGILSECTTEDMTQEERFLACHRFVSGGVTSTLANPALNSACSKVAAQPIVAVISSFFICWSSFLLAIAPKAVALSHFQYQKSTAKATAAHGKAMCAEHRR